uniref:Uncharacterized protein n=1 Tax=Hucho hucho TaxID=62062 RepID=A0A4W5JZZ9_9TELE
MSFPQLGYPQYLSASQAVYGGDRPGVLTPSSRGGSSEIAGNQSAAAAAVTSVLGMYANPYTAHNYSAFLPYSSADLALFSQMVRAISMLRVFYCSGLYGSAFKEMFDIDEPKNGLTFPLREKLFSIK